jgi:uncharacterized protein (DUF305 family)
MSIHHSQAVTLAMLAISRATRTPVREMAEDIAMTQQREVGVMAGWLQQWGLPVSATAPPMAWMNHKPAATFDADPPMPGMATRHDVARLATISGRGIDVLFCQLMLAHHLAGLHMISQVIQRGARPEVTALAVQMRLTQDREIAELNRLLTAPPHPTR